MLRMIAFATLGLIACTELPAAPGTGGAGGEGSGGVGGSAGAAGGTAGSGGIGGSGGADTCSVVTPERYAGLEEDDVVQGAVAIGRVSGNCPGVPCDGDDPTDRWAITTCGGEYRVALSWDESVHDLDLFLYNSDDSQSWASQGMDTTSESITADLQADEQYIIQVQAIDTNENVQTYNVVVN